jgi:phosphohistidine phosphatase
MNLYLLRHGLAVARGAAGHRDDEARPLTAKGQRKVHRVAQAMRAMELSFDAILTSPLVRARQTAAIVARWLGAQNKLEMTKLLAPRGSVVDVIHHLCKLKPRAGSVLLVGHEPNLSHLVSRLVSTGSEVEIAFKKSGLCKLTVRRLRVGRCATLDWLLTPRQMELMRKRS